MIIDFEQEKKNLAKRSAFAHKGDFGHVCVIGGGHLGYGGAVCLAAQAALRAGAGKVSAIVHPSALPRISGAPAELMCYAFDEINEDFIQLVNAATVIVLGPGLSQSPWAISVFNYIMDYLATATVPLVLDADGLNILAKSSAAKRKNWILTPHVGEAARLLGISPQEIQDNRVEAAKQLEAKWGGVIVLKGAGSLVCTQKEPIMECTAGNPGMSSGGMGDVLAGLIGALVAQGLNLYSAAKLGTLVHSMAADRQKSAGERGLLASDLFLEFRRLLN